MLASWRPLLIAALVLAPSAGAALALDELREMESLLRDLGFDPGQVDGVVDEATTAAIRRYQDFALLPGDPEPDERLLDELRGVAAAFAALNPGQAEAAAAAPEKTVVPPPPAPPKLKGPKVAPPEPAPPEPAPSGPSKPEPAPPEQAAPEPAAPAQTAALPPPATPGAPAATPGEAADPAAAMQARIDAELLRFLHRLNAGSLTREELARAFNAEGRTLMQQARYGDAILKFSVAIHLDPAFAGAYSNRGTAYRHQDEGALAARDFDKARELGFGGFRLRDAENPLD